MRKRLLKQQFLLVLLTMLIAIPQGVWAEDYPITVAGISPNDAGNFIDPTNEQTISGVTFAPAEGNTPATLTLNNAEIGGSIVSSLSALTIHLKGENTLNGFITTGGDDNTLNFTYSGNSSLNISSEETIISGFSDVDFGSLNLASTSAQGVYYDTDVFLMRGHETTPRDLTITTETYYPIWIYDPSLRSTGYPYTQLTGESTIEIGEGTVSFDDVHTITISNVAFNYDGNTMIVVGPSMEQLTVKLVGESTATNCSVLSLWDTTPLTFTTNESTPGTLTGYGIVSWKGNGNGQTSYQNGLKVFYDVTSSYKKTISTTGTYIKIGDTEVKATGDITIAEGTAHFDASSKTLTLTGATIGGATAASDIKAYVDDLIVEISGTNRIYGNITYSGSNYQSSIIQIKKKSDAESASLTASNVEGFASCTWDNDLYLTGHGAQETVIDMHYEHFENEGGSMQSYFGTISDVTFSTTESNTIWVAGIMSTGGDITGEGITTEAEGTVTYNATDRILTLTNVSLSTSETIPLIICNGDLTVNLVGEDNQVYFNGSYTYVFKNNASTGTLTFTDEGTLHINSDYDEGTYIGLCDGFSTVDFGELAYTINGDSKKISPLNISTPMMNVYEGKIDFQTDGYLFESTTYYKIVYADGSGDEEEIPLTNSMTGTSVNWSTYNEKVTISELTGPCTVYAYTKYNGETGASAKAKLFGFVDKKIALNSNTELTTDMLDIQPAIEENDGVNLTIVNSYNSVAIEYSEDTGKATIVGIGSCNLDVKMTLSKTPQITVLNMNGEVAMFSTEVTVVPAAPTIVKDPEKTYLDTDEITINLPEGEIYTECNIFYTWDEEVEIGNYDLFNESGTVIKKYTSPIPAQTGTLRAWVGYPNGDNYYYYGIEATPQNFEVIPDIENAVVVGLPASATYTGAAITPSFTVKASAEAEDNLVEGTDYTVRYEKVEGVQQPQEIQQPQAPRRAPEESESVTIKDAGGYIIIIEGKGNYGGTKTVGFTVTQADLADVTIAAIDDQTYTGEDLTPTLTVTFGENAVATDEYTVKYKKGTDVVEAVVEPGVYTVVLTSENKNFAANSAKSATFNILPAAPTIDFSSEVTYLDTDNIEVTAAEGMTIFYTWDTTVEVGNSYIDNPEHSDITLLTYDPEKSIIAQTGTLRAWAGYSLGDDEYLMSEVATQAFTVKKDINNAAIYISAASATYTGAAITPEFTLKESEEEGAATISADNYTVRYEKADDMPQAPRRAPEESESVTIKDAGDYIIIIEGKNEYGGTMGTPFTVNQASLANVAIADIDAVTYTGADLKPTTVTVTLGENAIAASEYTISYKQGETVVESAVNAGTYTIVLTSTNKNFAMTATATKNFTIGQAEITSVELVEASLAYSGEAQTPTIAKVMAGEIEVSAEYYEITGGNAKTDVGEYELTVAAKTMEGNNFKGSATTTWGIVNRTLTVGEDVQFADGQKWASFYTPSEDLELPEGVMAYIVTGVNESEKSVTVKAVNKVLKSVPMLLENNSTETTTNVSTEGNLLQVATEATAVSSINGTVYGLYNNAMMRVTTGTIALGKCYLVVNGKQNAPRLTITKDDQATGIESLTPALSEGEGVWYTIDGKKLQQKPTKKGIYIVNGKKMVVNNK